MSGSRSVALSVRQASTLNSHESTYPERRSDALSQPIPVLRVVAVGPLESRLGNTEVLCRSSQSTLLDFFPSMDSGAHDRPSKVICCFFSAAIVFAFVFSALLLSVSEFRDANHKRDAHDLFNLESIPLRPPSYEFGFFSHDEIYASKCLTTPQYPGVRRLVGMCGPDRAGESGPGQRSFPGAYQWNRPAVSPKEASIITSQP